MDFKNTNVTLLVLFTAALLEAGGDAIVRSGLHSSTAVTRMILFATGALVLFSYGYVVNAPAWDFGRLLGIYVVLFFVVAQLISWIVFHQRPSTGVLIGGAFIIIGGVIISYSS
jgi:drug/metabolite transporter superfamily protein YnfA